MPRGTYANISNVDRERLIKAFEDGGDWIGVRLPRYSPFLNIVEHCNSIAKAAVKRSQSDPAVQTTISDRNDAQNLGLTLHQHRMCILRRHIQDALVENTQQKCQNFMQHTLS